jgi:hypothetical protein
MRTDTTLLELDRRRGLERFLSRELVERAVACDLLRIAGERRTVSLLFAHDGMLDKFLGDGLMAIFGVLPDSSSGAAPAVRAALEMRVRIRRMNAEHAEVSVRGRQQSVPLATLAD